MSPPLPIAPPEATGREVAVTFDDLPVISVTRGDLESHRAITTRLLEAITSNQVPAVGFVNECKLVPHGVRDDARVELLQRWIAAGLELGNHTFSHLDLHRTPAAEFEADIIRGEPVTRSLLEA